MSQEIMHAEDNQAEDIYARIPPQEFDPNGDVIIVVGENSESVVDKFLLSSKVLSLASPVFAKLFSLNFTEGIELRKGKCPEIRLPEDDAMAMETIFRIVHFREPTEIQPLDTEFPARVAVHANKYDCIGALGAWMSKWLYKPQLKSQNNCLKAIDYGHLLLAAFLIRDSQSFKFFSTLAERAMAPDFFDQWAYSSMLRPGLFPQEVAGILRAKVGVLLEKMLELLQAVEESLEETKGSYLMDGLVCAACEHTLTPNTKRCRKCLGTKIQSRYCNSASRMALHAAGLKRAGLRTSIIAKAITFSGADLAERINAMHNFASLRHNCASGPNCPLKWELKSCYKKCRELLASADGMMLPVLLRCIEEARSEEAESED